MKKILLIFFALILILVGVLAYFVVTFDVNKYRPKFEAELSKAVGYPVILGDIDLKVGNGISLAVRNIGIYENEGATPDFEIVEVTAELRLMPLLNKSVEIGTVTIVRPDLKIRRDKTGELFVSGINLRKLAADQAASASETNPSGSSNNTQAKQAAVLPFLIDRLTLQEGRVRVIDEMALPPIDVTLQKITIELKNVSLIHPTDIRAEAALFSNDLNLFIESRFFPPRPGKPAFLKGGEVKIDFSKLDLAALYRAIPQAKESGIETLRGNLLLSADELPLDPNLLSQITASLVVSNGMLVHRDLSDAAQNIQLKGKLAGGNLNLENASLDWAESKVEVRGEVAQVFGNAQSRVNASIKNFNLAKLATKLPPKEPHMTGILTANFEGEATGLDWLTITTSATGQGRVKIEKPVLKNMNIVSDVLGQLNMVPGLSTRLDERLPAEYKEKLKTPQTVFEAIDLPIKVNRGVIDLNPLKLKSENFELTGSAMTTLNGMGETQFMIFLDPTLSDAIARSVEELRCLNDANGQLQLPLSYRGPLQQFRPFPNLQFVATKVATCKAQDLFNNLLKKQTGSGEEAQATTPETAPETGFAAQNTLFGGQQAPSQTTNQGQQQPAQPQTPEEQLMNLVGGFLQKKMQ